MNRLEHGSGKRNWNTLPFINIPRQYDGIALSADKHTMYITNWAPLGVSAIDMNTKTITPIYTDSQLAGPADMMLVDGTIYIPDLSNSRIIIKKL